MAVAIVLQPSTMKAWCGLTLGFRVFPAHSAFRLASIPSGAKDYRIEAGFTSGGSRQSRATLVSAMARAALGVP